MAPLRALTRAVDPRWPASIFATIHIGPRQSRLPELLGASCPLPLSPARDRAVIERGHVYVAPPDRHLYIESAHSALPRVSENWIGFFSPGPCEIAFKGLHKIQVRGACTIVQDSAEAMSPDLLHNAISR